MSTMSKIPGILFILVATSVALLVIIVLYSQEQIRQQSNIIETERIVKVNQLASRIDLIITNAEKILENAAKDENIKNPPYISSIDKNLHGIPESVDKEKRAVIRNILSTYQDFETIGYILPNGDIYFVEPYNLQKTLSVSNVSFRDYYKAVTATHDSTFSCHKNLSKLTILCYIKDFKEQPRHTMLDGVKLLHKQQKIQPNFISLPNL